MIISYDIKIIKIDCVILHDEPESTPLDIIHGPTMLQVFSPIIPSLFPTFASIISSQDPVPVEPIELENLIPTPSLSSPLIYIHNVVIPTEVFVLH